MADEKRGIFTENFVMESKIAEYDGKSWKETGTRIIES